MRSNFRLVPYPHPARDRAIQAIMAVPDFSVVTLDDDPPRNVEQNAAMWPLLEELAQARQWPVNGQMTWLSPEEWKDVLTAAFENETSPRLAAGYGGGVVMLGRRTSQWGKKRFSEWLDYLQAAVTELTK